MSSKRVSEEIDEELSLKPTSENAVSEAETIFPGDDIQEQIREIESKYGLRIRISDGKIRQIGNRRLTIELDPKVAETIAKEVKEAESNANSSRTKSGEYGSKDSGGKEGKSGDDADTGSNSTDGRQHSGGDSRSGGDPGSDSKYTGHNSGMDSDLQLKDIDSGKWRPIPEKNQSKEDFVKEELAKGGVTFQQFSGTKYFRDEVVKDPRFVNVIGVNWPVKAETVDKTGLGWNEPAPEDIAKNWKKYFPSKTLAEENLVSLRRLRAKYNWKDI
jgi:hypothetical protein